MDKFFDLVLSFIEEKGCLIKKGTCIDVTIVESANRPLSKKKREALEKSPSPQIDTDAKAPRCHHHCKMSRANRNPICAEHPESAFDFGYCAAQKLHYFGYKIYAVCTQQGAFKVFDITSTYVHDIHYLNDVKEQFNHCVFIGDKGYLSRYGKEIYLNIPPSLSKHR